MVAGEGGLLHRLVKFAKTPVEQKAAYYGPRLFDWSPLAVSENYEELEFLFRSYCVPQFCIHLLTTARKLWGVPPRFLWEHGCYILAFERTHFQIVLKRSKPKLQQQSYGGHTWSIPTGAAGFAQLPRPELNWFSDPPNGWRFWLDAFDGWKNAAVDSVRHRYPDSSGPTDRLMYAALAGDGLAGLKSLKQLHRDFTAYFEDEGSDELRVFISHLSKPVSEVHRMAKKSNQAQKNDVPARRPAIDAEETAKMTLALETWLLEIAPLVRAHHWGYPDILLIAKDKFGHEHELVLTTGQIRSRCEKVGLGLSPKAQNGGRPSNARKLALRKSLAAQMASALKSTGEGGEEWMLGQRGLCGNSTPAPWAEKGNLFKIVGTDDPGPERVWL